MATETMTMYFYKGTSLSYMMLAAGFRIKAEDVTKGSIELITMGQKLGTSKEQQIKDYKEQLNVIEQTMVDIEKEMGYAEVNKQLNELSKRMGKSREHLFMMWCLNINVLLLMKALNDDEMNGIMTVITVVND